MPHPRKNLLDKFYTRPDVARACLDRLDPAGYTRIIEPSAGAGAFSDLLFADPRLAGKVEAHDLAPENPRVAARDWFACTTVDPDDRTLVVGNPPFGRQSSLAVRFLNHAFDQVGAATVAFILPRGFRKPSVQGRLHPYAHLRADHDVGDDAFLLNGQPYHLPAVFQVWQREDTPRPASSGATTSTHFTFVRPDEPHQVVVRRVGGRTGTAFHAGGQASAQTNYFLRLGDGCPDADGMVALVNGMAFPQVDDTTGPRSLTKRELVDAVDSALRRAA